VTLPPGFAVPAELTGSPRGRSAAEIFRRETALEQFFTAHRALFTPFDDYFRLRTYEFRVVRSVAREEFRADRPFERVVEIGCGFGFRLLTLAPFARELVGVDIPEPYHAFRGSGARPVVEMAEELVSRHFRVPETTFHGAYPTALPLEDGSADLLYSEYTLEHVPEMSAFAREAARIVRTGGLTAHVVPLTADAVLAFVASNARVRSRALGSVLKGWIATLIRRPSRTYRLAINGTLVPPCHSEFARSFGEQVNIYRLERYLMPLVEAGFMVIRTSPVREHSCLVVLRKEH
jgi:SAM-dependent methyltransferase